MDESLVREGSLGSILFRSHIITEDDIRAALDEQKKSGARFGEALVTLGVVAQEDIDWALSSQLNIPYVRLKPGMIDRDATRRVPAALARKYGLIPLIVAGDEMSIAIADPLNLAATSEVEQLTGCSVSVSVALNREIREMQDIFYGPAEIEDSLGFSSPSFPEKALAAINADPTGAKLLDYLLLYIIQQRLTSISFHPFEGIVLISAKREGVTREIGRLVTEGYEAFLAGVKNLAKIDDDVDVAARGALAFVSKGKKVFFQAATLKGEEGELLTLKLHITSPFPARLSELGASEETVGRFNQLLSAARGLVLFCARDLDDRTRLMDLYLEERDTTGKNVLLLGNRAGRGRKRFPRIPLPSPAEAHINALVMAALEHDPDFIAMEDATDSKGFTAAFKGAMRGKTMLAGLALADAAALFKHLLRFWQKNYFVPSYLKGIMTCRGVLTLCPECKELYEPSREELATLRLAKACNSGFYRAVGCSVCDQTGYSGRKYLLEVINFNEGLLKRFETARDAAEIVTYLKECGHHGIVEEGAALLCAGEISPGEFVASVLL